MREVLYNIWSMKKRKWIESRPKTNMFRYTLNKHNAEVFTERDVENVLIVEPDARPSLADGFYNDNEGTYVTFKEGWIHSIDDRPAKINRSRDRNHNQELWWYDMGSIQRLDGPCVVWTNTQSHVNSIEDYINFKIDYNIIETSLWCINGTYIKTEQKEIETWLKENDIQWPFNEDQQILFRLRFM